MDNNFYTQKNYIKNQGLSSAKEDYLEMIFRICQNKGYARITDVALNLNVGTSSVSKMASALKLDGLIDYEKYSIITLTQKGHIKGEYLLKRHNTLNAFFAFVNNSADETILTEQVEHFFDEKTVQNLEKLLLNLIKN